MMICDKCGRAFTNNDIITYNPISKKYIHSPCYPGPEREAAIPIITIDAVKEFLADKCGQSDRQEIYEFLHNSLGCRMG